MFSILINDNDGVRNRLAFKKREITVGRIRGNDIILPKGNISKRHCKIFFKGDKFIVTDLRSTNGTFVNGYKITSPTILREGDRVYIGEFVLTLSLEKKFQKEEVRSGLEPMGLSPIVPPQKEQELSSDEREFSGQSPGEQSTDEQSSNESAVHSISSKEKKSTQDQLENPDAAQEDADNEKRITSETIASSIPVSFLDDHSSKNGPSERQPSRPTEIQGVLSSALHQNPDARIWNTLLSDEAIVQLRVNEQGEIWVKKTQTPGQVEKSNTFKTHGQIFSSLQAAEQTFQMYLEGKGAQFSESQPWKEATINNRAKISYLTGPMFTKGLWVKVERWTRASSLEQLEKQSVIDSEALVHIKEATQKSMPIFVIGSNIKTIDSMLGALIVENPNQTQLLFENQPSIQIENSNFFRWTGKATLEPNYVQSIIDNFFGNEKLHMWLCHLSPLEWLNFQHAWMQSTEHSNRKTLSVISVGIFSTDDAKTWGEIFSQTDEQPNVTKKLSQHALLIYTRQNNAQGEFFVTSISKLVEGKEQVLFTKSPN